MSQSRKMMKNRTFQLIYQSMFCAFALVALIGSVGLYNYRFTSEFYTYFTNISAYLCMGIMAAELVQTARRQGNGYVTVAPGLKVIGMLGTLLTLLVFNLLLANAEGRDPAMNFRVESLLLHGLLPLMYIGDWILFYEHGKLSWKVPLLSALFPLSYVGYVYFLAALRHFDSSVLNTNGTAPVIYPYFFLNPEIVGISGVFMWIGILLAAFILMGYLFFGLDRLLASRPLKQAP